MKVCFIGAGSIGKRHIKNLAQVCREKGINLEIHLYRTSDKRLDEETGKEVDRVVYRYDQLDEKYAAVFITNPTYRHFETLESFIHKSDCFFIEKPVFNDCSRDISHFPVKGKTYYVACPLRYTEVLREAQKIVQEEKVCSVRAITSSYLPAWRPGTDYRQTYSAHKRQGGGVRLDLIHEWDYLISLFGYPERVFSLDGRYSDLEIDCEDIAVYIAEYRDKLLELHLDYFGKVTRRSLELRTTEHEYIFDIQNSSISCDGIVRSKFQENPNDKYLREMRTFFEMACGGKCTVNGLENAVNVMKIAENISDGKLAGNKMLLKRGR